MGAARTSDKGQVMVERATDEAGLRVRIAAHQSAGDVIEMGEGEPEGFVTFARVPLDQVTRETAMAASTYQPHAALRLVAAPS